MIKTAEELGRIIKKKLGSRERYYSLFDLGQEICVTEHISPVTWKRLLLELAYKHRDTFCLSRCAEASTRGRKAYLIILDGCWCGSILWSGDYKLGDIQ